MECEVKEMKDRNKTKKQLINELEELRQHIAELELLIGERKEKEDGIKALKQEMEFIVGVTKTGLDIIDSKFNIRYIDPAWAKVYGDPAGKKCYEYFMGRKGGCLRCGIIEALKTKKPIVTEEVLVKENNRPIQVTTIPFKNEAGEWLLAKVNVDITERKKMEEAVRELRRNTIKWWSMRIKAFSLPKMVWLSFQTRKSRKFLDTPRRNYALSLFSNSSTRMTERWLLKGI